MRKLFLAGAFGALLIASPFAFHAIAAPGRPPSPAQIQHMQDEMATMLDAHLASMKSALKLNADQDQTWASFEAVVRSAAKTASDAMTQMASAMKTGEPGSPIQHLQIMSDHMAMASGELKKVADAAKPLYDGLDEGQKRRFGPLLASLMPSHPRGHGGIMGWMHHEPAQL